MARPKARRAACAEIDQRAVVRALTELATLMELGGANLFKVRAHLNAARAVETGEFDVLAEAASGTLGERKGFGEALVRKISGFVETGVMEELEELRVEVPEGLLVMLRIPGFGPKKIQVVWKKLGITTLGALEEACEEKRLRDLAGFGAKTEESILKAALVAAMPPSMPGVSLMMARGFHCFG